MRNGVLIGLSLIVTLFSTSKACAAETSIAIVVHPGVAESNITMEQLRRLFHAEQQFWADKTRVTLLLRAPVAADRDLILDRIYHMNENEFRRYWIAKIFRAEVPSGPKVVFSSNMALELVTAIPGSITFLPTSELDSKVKVLSIDGFLPHDSEYPLR